MDGLSQDSLDQVIELVSSWGLQVIGAIAVLIVGRWVASFIRRGVTRGLERANTDATLVPFISSMAYYLAITVVVIAVLNLFGIETTSLVAVVGAIILAVGASGTEDVVTILGGVILAVGILASGFLRHTQIDYEVYERLERLEKSASDDD